MSRIRLAVAAGVVIVVAAGAAAMAGLTAVAPAGDAIPTTRPQRGDVEVRVTTRGELAALRSVSLVAPSVAGSLQLVTLLPAGTRVAAGDLVMAFDPAEQRYNLAQAESEVAEAEEEIRKLQADAKVKAAQNEVDLLKAKFAVRRAELEVAGNEFVGRIQAEQNLLTLEQEKQRQAQIQADAAAHAESSRAALAVLEEKRQKALIAKQLAERNIESMTVTAPMDGLVVIRQNQGAAGGIFYTGMVLPEFRQGDTVQPGNFVADIVDLSEMELKAKVSETDRPVLAEGSAADVQVHALPAADLTGTAKGVAGLATRSMWEASSVTRQFDAAFQLHAGKAPVPLRPGMTARIVVKADPLVNVTHLPRQVLFEKGGKPVVYVRRGTGFEAVEVKVARITESRVVLDGFAEDAEVALVNPERETGPGSAAPATPPLPGGGR